MRGRDHGIPDYNTVRELYGLRRIDSFSDEIFDEEMAKRLNDTYGDLGMYEIDAIVGGLAEKHLYGSAMGELFTHIWAEQFKRLRDCDRFFYKNYLSDKLINYVESVLLVDIIQWNTQITGLQDFVMQIPPIKYNSVSSDDSSSKSSSKSGSKSGSKSESKSSSKSGSKSESKSGSKSESKSSSKSESKSGSKSSSKSESKSVSKSGSKSESKSSSKSESKSESSEIESKTNEYITDIENVVKGLEDIDEAGTLVGTLDGINLDTTELIEGINLDINEGETLDGILEDIDAHGSNVIQNDINNEDIDVYINGNI